MMAAVRVYIELNRSDGDAPFCLMTSFPRKVFTSDDYEKPLDELGNVIIKLFFISLRLKSYYMTILNSIILLIKLKIKMFLFIELRL